MYLATYDTQHYTFRAIGSNKRRLVQRMTEAWERHCQQTGADRDYFKPDEIEIAEMTPNVVYRDGFALL